MSGHVRGAVAVVAGWVLAGSAAGAPLNAVYFADSDGIKKAAIDGDPSGWMADLIVPRPINEPQNGFTQITDLAIDHAGGRIVWSEATTFFNGTDLELTGAIRSAGLDGSAVQTIVSADVQAKAIEIDPASGALYWIGETPTTGATLRSAALDGTNQQVIAAIAQTDITSLELDAAEDQLYFTTLQTGPFRSGLDGTGVEAIGGLPSFVNDLDFDPVDRVLYSAQSAAGGRVSRTPLDPADPSSLMYEGIDFGAFGPRGVSFDPTSGMVYWSVRSSDPDARPSAIYRAFPDGSGLESFLSDDIQQLNGPGKLVVGPIPSPGTAVVIAVMAGGCGVRRRS